MELMLLCCCTSLLDTRARTSHKANINKTTNVKGKLVAQKSQKVLETANARVCESKSK